MAPSFRLPVGKQSEVSDGTVGQKLNNVAESLVLLHSLRQSREFWLLSALQKFSTKSRGKQPAENHNAPHSIKAIGKYDIEIGPHIFYDTVFFEVRYLFTNGDSAQYKPPMYPDQSSPQASSSSFTRLSPPPVVPLDPSVEVTPALISQVNQAAATNPTLQNLLQLAASGRASHEQLKTLGILVQSLAMQPNLYPSLNHPQSYNTPSNTLLSEKMANAGSSSEGGFTDNGDTRQSKGLSQDGLKSVDFVIEFRENMYDRWIFPREVLACEQEDLGQEFDIMLKIVAYGNLSEKSSHDELHPVQKKPTMVSVKIKKAPTLLWRHFTSLLKDMPDKLKDDVRPADRAFLQYQLPDGPFLTQLQNTISHYSMKFMKPTAFHEGPRAKRVSRPRKTILGGNEGVQKKKPASSIACLVCNVKNVPLLSSGRYCRQCLEKMEADTQVRS